MGPSRQPQGGAARDHDGYAIALEVAGPLALFVRLDAGSTPTSYAAPTWSAAKGLFESIAFFADGSASATATRFT